MDWNDIARRAAAAREFTHVLAAAPGRSFTLRLPTHDEMRIAVLAHGMPSAGDDAGLLEWEKIGQELIERAVVGWNGVLFSDVIDGEVDEPIEWAAAGVPVLLAAKHDWSLELRAALMRAITERTARTEAARKN